MQTHKLFKTLLSYILIHSLSVTRARTLAGPGKRAEYFGILKGKTQSEQPREYFTVAFTFLSRQDDKDEKG